MPLEGLSQYIDLDMPMSIDTSAGGAPDPSAILDIRSQTQGLLVPRMNALERTSISSPQGGLLVYDLDVRSLFYYDGDSWVEFGSGRKGIRDGDFDTSVKVEEAMDEDLIRMKVAGQERVVIGANSIALKSTKRNSIIGDMAGGGTSNVLSEDNTVFGYDAGNDVFAGARNVLLGSKSGRALSFSEVSDDNVIIGHGAGAMLEEANGNILVGAMTYDSATWGADNVFIGDRAGQNIRPTSRSSVYIGVGAGGTPAGHMAQTNNNVVIGHAAGQQLDGPNNIMIGDFVGTSTTATFDNCILIGSNPHGFLAGKQRNKLVIGQSFAGGQLIYGDFSDRTLTIAEKLGINEASPESELHVLHVNNNTAGGLTIENEENGNDWRLYTTSSSGSLRFYSKEGGGGSNDYVAFVNDATGSWNTNSDMRLKENISPVNDVLDRVNQLNVVEYNFKREVDKVQPHIGLIAQEVEPVFPSLVHKDEGGLYALSYGELGPIAIKAIQELIAKNDQLESENHELNNKVNKLESDFQRLLEKVDAMTATRPSENFKK